MFKTKKENNTYILIGDKMKCLYKIEIVIFFFICLFLLDTVDARINELPLLGRIIFVDPGHGGTCLSQINYNENNISSKIEEMTILVSKYKSLRYLIKVSFFM